jgi:hypothetical protein
VDLSGRSGLGRCMVIRGSVPTPQGGEPFVRFNDGIINRATGASMAKRRFAVDILVSGEEGAPSLPLIMERRPSLACEVYVSLSMSSRISVATICVSAYLFLHLMGMRLIGGVSVVTP